MKIEPKALFGPERYHRKLVEFLRERKAHPDAPLTENFQGVSL